MKEKKNDSRVKTRKGGLERKWENFWRLMGRTNRRMKGQRPNSIRSLYEVFHPFRNQNIFKTRFIISEKSSFWLEALKNWWSLLEISEWGIDLEFDNLAQKIYLHNLVEQKEWHVSKALFFWKKKNSLKIKHLKKIHFSSFWIWQFE